MHTHDGIETLSQHIRKRSLSLLASRSAEELPENRLNTATPDSPALQSSPQEEGEQFAREVLHAFEKQMAIYRAADEREKDSLDPRHSECAPSANLDKRLELTTFYDLERLSRTDPERAMRRWEEVKATARRDLGSGWIAGRTIEPTGGSAWDRACFQAIRECLHRAWQPRHAYEAMLLDQLAQYEMLRLRWLKTAVNVPHDDATQIAFQRCDPDRDEKKIALTAKALRESMRMVERLQRLSQNALRMLLMMRRKQMPNMNATIATLNVAVGEQWNALIAGAVPEATPDVES